MLLLNHDNFRITSYNVCYTKLLRNPASENASFYYLLLCGVVAICSMILPGLSGSFVLILMGNYQLVMINAVSEMNLNILLPIAIGAAGGLVAFSHFLSWLLKKFHNQTIALLTGFIAGSLGILWPWKNSFNSGGEIIPTNQFGAFIHANGAVIQEKIKVYSYDWFLPEMNGQLAFALLLMILGIASIMATELFANKQKAA